MNYPHPGLSVSENANYIRRLERADARNTLACAVARGRRHGFDAKCRWIAGGYAIYAGHWTHLTQGIALGISGEVTARGVQQVSRFFRDHLAIPTVHVCESVPSAIRHFEDGGYGVIGSWNILARSVRPSLILEGAALEVTTERCKPGQNLEWIHACSQGFLSKAELTHDELEVGSIVAGVSNAERFIARGYDGHIYGTAAVTCSSGVALLFADSTRPAYRGRGAQPALIRARLAHARTHKCNVAMAVVEPGSGSERNYLRCGFRKVYQRLTLQELR